MPEENGSNGSGSHGEENELLGRWLGRRLNLLRGEMSANRQRFESIELRLDGLARVLMRDVPFAGEHAGQVAEVVAEAATIEHQQGELLFVAAEEIRQRAKTHH